MSDSVKIFFAGDFCSKSSSSLISVSDALQSEIKSCDLAVINFEVPLKPDISLPKIGYERLFQNDDVPEFLRKLGFNLFSLANNHSFDWGIEGFLKTKSAIGDMAFGAGTYDEAYSVKVCEVHGMKVGFLALSYAAYYGVFDSTSDHNGYGCAYINDLKVNHVILEAKKEVDCLIILPHDGIEYIDIPLSETIGRYRDFIDYGADVVIGSHPHCPQGWETYKGKPIFYSLGNFFFNSKETPDFHADRPHWYEGLCLELNIGNDISFRIINTKNTGNLSLDIDDNPERDNHNQYLCSLLSDKSKYDACLNNYLNSKAISNEMNLINLFFTRKSLPALTKRVIKEWLKILLRKPHANDIRLRMLLKNDSRRAAIIKHLSNL